jgi:hypothetical protein
MHPRGTVRNLLLDFATAIVCRMTAKLTILLSGEVLSALRAAKNMTITVGGGRGAAPAQAERGVARNGGGEPREGSLPARVLDWAKARSKPFGTADITKKFKLSRAHASMLLSRLASGPYAIRREKRGRYTYGR